MEKIPGNILTPPDLPTLKQTKYTDYVSLSNICFEAVTTGLFVDGLDSLYNKRPCMLYTINYIFHKISLLQTNKRQMLKK